MAELDLLASPGLHNDEHMVRLVGGLPMSKSKIGETTFRRITVESRERTERALLVIDKSGGGPYIDVHDINEHPPLEDLVSAVDELTKISHSAHLAKNDKRLAIRAEHPGRDRRNITA